MAGRRRHPHRGSHTHRHFHGRRKSTHHTHRGFHHHPHKGSHAKRPGAHHAHKTHRRVVKHVTRHPTGHHGARRVKVQRFLKLRKLRKDRARLHSVRHRLARYLRKPRRGKVSKG